MWSKVEGEGRTGFMEVHVPVLSPDLHFTHFISLISLILQMGKVRLKEFPQTVQRHTCHFKGLKLQPI